VLPQRSDWEIVMPKTAFQINLKKPPEEAAIKTHNRWHPDIPMVDTFKPGAEIPRRVLRLDGRADRQQRKRQ